MSSCMEKRSKISLIGAGNIGSTLAHIIALEELGDVVLFDKIDGLSEGKALDLSQSTSVEGISVSISGANSYEDLQDSDVVIITAGFPRKPNMSRDDLTETNAKVIKSLGREIALHCPNAFVIVVTNPLDAMVYELQRSSGLPPQKVVGMAGILDSSRFCYFLAKELDVSIKDINSIVLGGHGDSMVPLLDHTSINGIPLRHFIKTGKISQPRLNEIMKRTRYGGAEIVNFLKTGSAFYAPASAAVAMARSYLKDENRTLPCSAQLNGEYGVSGIYMGVPVVIGKNGVEEIVELSLSQEEKEAFERSVLHVKNLVNSLDS